MEHRCGEYYSTHLKDYERIYEEYISPRAQKQIHDASLFNPAKRLSSLYAAGKIGGDTLIDVSMGPTITHLLAVSGAFKNIFLLRPNPTVVAEMRKWWQGQSCCFQFSHIGEQVCELRGNREDHHKLEEKLKKAIKDVLPCDFTKEKITEREELPEADCALAIWTLPQISNNEASLISNIHKMSSLVKPGGHLVLFGGVDGTYFKVGDQKFQKTLFKESVVRKALLDAGCSVESFEVWKNTLPQEMSDITLLSCVVAVKDH